MRYSRRAVAVTVMVVLCATVWVIAQDRKLVDPSMKVLFENDRVRVQEHYLKPGAENRNALTPGQSDLRDQ